jgi:Na+-transporting NADH:ubiquinone oxidoreductase subunit A
MKLTKSIRIKKGANLKILGEASKILKKNIVPSSFSIKPTDFFDLIPKLFVKEGDKVKQGTPIFYSKENPNIKFVSPVSGSIRSIVRGAKRKILELIIDSDNKNSKIKHDISFEKNDKVESQKIINLLLESGCWPYLKQRPYGVLADPNISPKAIFISTIDKAPLGVDYDFILKSRIDDFQLGVNVLKKIFDGDIFLGLDKNYPGFFENIKNVNIYNVQGPHPSGDVSFHIHNISPINPGEKVWTINPEDVSNIGSFFKTGYYSPKRTIALAGSVVKEPRYYETITGSELKKFLKDSKVDNNVQIRCINGNVLNGKIESSNGFIGYFNNLVTIIPEGNDYRMFGWLPFVDNKILSLSNTSLSWLFNSKGSEVNSNLNGEERALVVTGEMENVFPMDIYPMQLIKACLAFDIEKMEGLGIYEVVPEDFGLIDFSNTSKIEAQEIIREGIELMINEVG